MIVYVSADLEQIAGLLQQRNALDAQIAAVIDRPVTAGHLGEWIAARVFGVELERSATAAAIDGRFTSGSLQGRTVNVKWYPKRENLLDFTESAALDYYLVFTGPVSPAVSSRGGSRPWIITAVYLFDAQRVLGDLRAQRLKIKSPASVRAAQWEAAEIFPRANSDLLTVDPEQARLLRLFAPAASSAP